MAFHIENASLERMQVNVKERWEVKVWCCLFNCSSEELKRAVKKVGSSAGAVKRIFKSDQPV